MRAEIVREQPAPPPPVKSVKLEMSVAEAKALFALGNFGDSVSRDAMSHVRNAAPFRGATREGMRDALYAVFYALQREGIETV